MEKYEIEFRKSVEKDLSKLPRKDQIRILRRIQQLTTEPRPSACKKLSAQERFRVRQGNYRIIYEIHDGTTSIVVVKIANRREAYR